MTAHHYSPLVDALIMLGIASPWIGGIVMLIAACIVVGRRP